MYWGRLDFSKLVRPSEHRRNKYGEIGSPCLMPREGLKGGDKTPLILTEKLTDDTHFIIKLHHIAGKPIATIMVCR
jgi:hypothetical protein